MFQTYRRRIDGSAVAVYILHRLSSYIGKSQSKLQFEARRTCLRLFVRYCLQYSSHRQQLSVFISGIKPSSNTSSNDQKMSNHMICKQTIRPARWQRCRHDMQLVIMTHEFMTSFRDTTTYGTLAIKQ